MCIRRVAVQEVLVSFVVVAVGGGVVDYEAPRSCNAWRLRVTGDDTVVGVTPGGEVETQVMTGYLRRSCVEAGVWRIWRFL